MTLNSDTSLSNEAVMFGASVAGPAHLVAGLPNQDAWVCHRWISSEGNPYYCAVVCDGLGSRSHAREGAVAAVRAAKRAARQWSRALDVPVGLLVRLIEVLWRLEVAPLLPINCATTCAVVIAQPAQSGHRLVILVLGDGQVIVEDSHGVQVFGGRAEEQFSNVTVGLGTPHHMEDWQVQDIKSTGQCRVLLLSDGIADDVPAENIAELLDWVAEFEIRPASTRGRALRQALRKWPVPSHTDDKTLVYLRMGAR